jgi:hypothetical protein
VRKTQRNFQRLRFMIFATSLFVCKYIHERGGGAGILLVAAPVMLLVSVRSDIARVAKIGHRPVF